MIRTKLSILALCSTLVFNSALAHANNPFSRFYHWAKDSAESISPYHQQKRAQSQLLGCAVGILLVAAAQNKEQKQRAYKEARIAFLESIPSEVERELARETIKSQLQSDNSDALDLQIFHRLLTTRFRNVTGTSFRKLAVMFLKRSDFFQNAPEVQATVKLLADAAPMRQMESGDIALLQIAMIKALNTFELASAVIKSLRVVFSDWALAISADDFFAVASVVAEEIKTFKSAANQQEAVEIVRAFAQRLAANERLQLWLAD